MNMTKTSKLLIAYRMWTIDKKDKNSNLYPNTEITTIKR